MSETARFAPSPTGRLHLGHAYAAMRAHDTAHQSGADGRFLLRIEDLDQERSREEFVEAIYEDLHWLGLSWEEPILRQSERSIDYQHTLSALERMQLTYPCFCSRRDIAAEIASAAAAPHPADPDHISTIYPGTCRRLSAAERERRLRAGLQPVIRLDCQRAREHCGHLQFTELGTGPNGERGLIEVRADLSGDIVLARRDLPAAYHLAVVIDDAHQHVSLVTRGSDLFAATHIQRVLQCLLDLPVPRYAHHRLILDANGRKFSKRDRSTTLQSLRQNGISADQVRARITGL